MGPMTRRIHIRPDLPDKELGERQWRIISGLLTSGMDIGGCRALPWYDARLEVYYPAEACIRLGLTYCPANTAANSPANMLTDANSPANTGSAGERLIRAAKGLRASIRAGELPIAEDPQGADPEMEIPPALEAAIEGAKERRKAYQRELMRKRRAEKNS